MTRIILALAAVWFGAACTAAQTTAPSVSPEAGALLDRFGESFARLRSLQCSATVSLDANVLDRPTRESETVTTHFVAPNRFRSEMTGGALVVSTGSKCFLFVPRLAKYLEAPAPADRAGFDVLPAQIRTVLSRQDPSLYLAACANPREALLRGAHRITRADDVVIDGRAHPTLLLEQADEDITLTFDPQTHLVRRITLDHRKLLTRSDVPAAEKALVTIDYTDVRVDGPIEEGVFEWSPPGNASPLPLPATRPQVEEPTTAED